MRIDMIIGIMCALIASAYLTNKGTDAPEVSQRVDFEKEDSISSDTEETVKRPEEDVFLLDMSFFTMWESGDYSEEDGTPCINKRRLRYPEYIEKEHDNYDIELSENFVLVVFEYDEQKNYIKNTTITEGTTFVPQEQTRYFTMSLHRMYSEKSLSYGQWNAIFTDKICIRISHGDVEEMEASVGTVKLCKTSNAYTETEKMVQYLLDNQGESLASALWHNQILNGTYGLTRENLNNGNLTIYLSSSEGDDANSGLSPYYPKKSLETYSGMSNINVLLKCGDTFQMTDTFQVGSNCVIAAYGEGERPILNYYREAEFAFEKVKSCDLVWVADLSGAEIYNGVASKSNCNIGQLLIEGEVNWKRTVGSTSDIFEPATLDRAADGSWAADWNSSTLYLYSEKNPNELSVSYAPPLHAVSMDNVKNVVFRGIEITGVGMHGISMKDVEDITISNCYIHHIGGSILVSAGVRYGNAIQLWDGGEDILVSHNIADWIFDTCYTNQGTDSECVEENVVFEKNIGAHAFWGIETWGAGFSKKEFDSIEYSHNIIYDIMDITNPEMPMYSSKSGKEIFADKNTVKEDYVSYRCGYTYHQMSSVNVSNSGLGEPPRVYHNVFWNTNRFLALISNDRLEDKFSCLQDNLFYAETDVSAPALFRYEEGDGHKKYLEILPGYMDEANRVKIWEGEETGDNSAQRDELVKAMKTVAGATDIGGIN